MRKNASSFAKWTQATSTTSTQLSRFDVPRGLFHFDQPDVEARAISRSPNALGGDSRDPARADVYRRRATS
jgi:hypothetical protein